MSQTPTTPETTAVRSREATRRMKPSERSFRRKKLHYQPRTMSGRMSHRDSLGLMGRPTSTTMSKNTLIESLDGDDLDDAALDEYLSNLVNKMSTLANMDESSCRCNSDCSARDGQCSCTTESCGSDVSQRNESGSNAENLFQYTNSVQSEIEGSNGPATAAQNAPDLARRHLDRSPLSNRETSRLPGEKDEVKSRSTSRLSLNGEDLRRSNTFYVDFGGRPPRSHLCVAFDKVEVREYPIEVGDNPSCGTGPALTIGWDYKFTKKVPLFLFEENHPQRRQKKELYLSAEERMETLRAAGFADDIIAEAIEQIASDRVRRMKTLLNLKYCRYEETMQSAMRKTLRFVRLQKKDDELLKIWKAPISNRKVGVVSENNLISRKGKTAYANPSA